MRTKKYWILPGSLLLLAILIHVFSGDQMRVERYYSRGIYPFIAAGLRYVFGWLPFSIGDILYGIGAILLIRALFRFIRQLYRNKFSPKVFLPFLYNILILSMVIYIVFNLIWGINYNRIGIADQLGLRRENYNRNMVIDINLLLLKKVNDSKTALVNQKTAVLTNQALFSSSADNYGAIVKSFPFLKYNPASVKVSLWGWLGNYIGFAGYYNPFTGEAQVNTTMPKFLQPYTACHEIAHQLGYAKEDEANFVGYLAASASKDTQFQYSVYLDLFLYANRNLSGTDTAMARAFVNHLLPEVKADIREWRAFSQRHKNPVEPWVRWMYGKYLQGNQQPSGVLTYDEVTGFLIAYYQKFGKI